jgi:simple sugar transport system permease protein
MTDTLAPLQPMGAVNRMIDAYKSRTKIQRSLLLVIFALTVLAFARVLADANDLTSSGTVAATLRVSAPLICAGLAALWAERVGIVNIGIEGMMILGTWFGAFGAWKFGPWIGILFGIGGGLIGGLIHAVATIRFNVDHVISGVAINILAGGATNFLSSQFFVGHQGGGLSQSPPQKSPIPSINLPVISGGKLFGWKSPDVAGWIEKKHWFLVSDGASLIRGLTRDLSWATLIVIALVPISAWVLWRTRFGLRLRSSGENPFAAASLGVSIPKVRYAGVAISGGLAGLGGAFLSIVAANIFREGQTGGQGFIGLATTIFGNWRPTGVLSGGLLFGFASALRLRADSNIPALLLVVAIALTILTIIVIRRRRLIGGVVVLVCAGLAYLGYGVVEKIPQSLTSIAPHVITLIVLSTMSQRLRPPAYAGFPYLAGEAH